jgi:hypothetical protein
MAFDKKSICLKISSHKQYDQKRFGVKGDLCFNDILELYEKQKGHCYICDCEMIVNEWTPKCLYQISIDRLDNKKPHNRDNILLSCYHCNCCEHEMFQQDTEQYSFKLCLNKCHTIPNAETPCRQAVSQDKINALRLGPKSTELNSEEKKKAFQKIIDHFDYVKRKRPLTPEEELKCSEAKEGRKAVTRKEREDKRTCETCKKVFTQRHHYLVHLNRVNKCVAPSTDNLN